MSCEFYPGGAVVADGYLVGFTPHEPEMVEQEGSPLRDIANIVYKAKAERQNWPFNDNGTRWALHPPTGDSLTRFAMSYAVDYQALKKLVRETAEVSYGMGQRDMSVKLMMLELSHKESTAKLTAERDELLEKVKTWASLQGPAPIVMDRPDQVPDEADELEARLLDECGVKVERVDG